MSLGLQADGAARRYGRFSIFLHWTIAALIAIQVCLGWFMNEVLGDRSPARAQIVGIHISVGLTILLFVLLRLAVRLGYPTPPLPMAMPAWERALARATHVMLYMLMLAMPLTGWAIVSVRNPTTTFWGLPLPALPGLHALAAPAEKATRHSLSHTHVFLLVWILLIALALHVGGALWGQLEGTAVLWRMGVTRRPGSRVG
jgi:cytochrome b561